MTVIRVMPAASAFLACRASVAPSAGTPPVQVKSAICRPSSMRLLWANCYRLPGERAVCGARVQFGGSPAVPRYDAAVRPVRVAERIEFLRGRRRDAPGEPVPLPHAQVSRGPDVQPPQLEQQEHLRRPRADTADGREPGDHLFVT